MTQLIVSLSEDTALSDIKKAIKLLRGVTDVKVRRKETMPKATRKAMEELKSGDTITLSSVDEYLKLIESV